MHDSVTAPLNYLATRTADLATYTYDPPDGAPRFNGQLQAHETRIWNARELSSRIGFDECGFTCVRRRSQVAASRDDAQLRASGYAEAGEWIADALKASTVIVFDHTYRQRAPGRPPLDGLGGSFSAVRSPVGRVHADFTPRSAPARIAGLLGLTRADPLPPYRIVGLWRSLNPQPLNDAPLALASAPTVDPADLVPNAIVYPDRRGETYAVLHNARHRWFYYPAMEDDEALLFLHFDSRYAQAGTVPHTAFEDPTSPADAAPRHSLEMRALVLA